jgi:dihydroorotate dehydrogenase
MYDLYVSTRNGVTKFFYKNLLKPIFFLMDPEVVHDQMTWFGKGLGKTAVGRWLLRAEFNYENPMLSQEVRGMKFKNPIGLAAGFDKNAELTKTLPQIGFGFAELGSITGEACPGNPKPRLWRLKRSESLVVYYGLKNDGAEALSAKLKKLLPPKGKRDFVYGISVAKTNSPATCVTEAGVADYAKAYRLMREVADYITVNISCPNAFGGEPFTDVKSLEMLLKELDKLHVPGIPVLIKLSPDLSRKEIDNLLEVCDKHKIDGFVCSNLTKKRDNPKIKDQQVPDKGGISGKVVHDLTNDLIEHIYKRTGGKKLIMGVGGVFTAEDAYAKIRLGANLIQMITGMIFEGPSVMSEINQGLVKLLKRDGFKNVSEAVGVDVKLTEKAGSAKKSDK